MNTIGTKAQLAEQFRYTPQALTEREIYDALRELEEWRATAYEFSCDDSEELGAYIDKLEDNQENPDHAQFDDYKSFFEVCVESLNAHWPAAEPYDTNLRDVICSAIARGDVDEEEEEEEEEESK